MFDFSADEMRAAACKVEAVICRSDGSQWGPAALEVMKRPSGSGLGFECVGVDANVLLAFARDPGAAIRFHERVEAIPGVSLVVPMQAFQESWNNVRSVSKKLQTPLKKLREAIEEFERLDGGAPFLESLKDSLQAAEIDEDSKEDIDVAVENLQKELERLLELGNTCLSTFPRSDAARLCDTRFGSKTPPGFMDVKDKQGQHYGDFYVWLDFLVGAAAIRAYRDNARMNACFVTNDVKDDWLVAGRYPQPLLSMESQVITGGSLTLMKLADFIKGVD